MRSVLLAIVVLVAADAGRAGDAPKATGAVDSKKVTFPEEGVADGVKATVGLLESCCDKSLYQADEFKKAQQGDHVRLVFAKPTQVTVMGEKVEVSELVFRLPLETGVFWVRSGDEVRRYAKYQCQKEEPFVAWLRKAQPAH